MNDNGVLGAGEQAEIEAALAHHLAREQGWTRNVYRLDFKEVSSDGRIVTFWAVHADDEKGLAPGGGKSLILRVDRHSKKVVSTLRFQ